MAEEKPAMDLAALKKWLESQAKALEKRAEEGKIAPEEILTAKAVAEQLRSIKVTHVAAQNDDAAANGAPARKQVGIKAVA